MLGAAPACKLVITVGGSSAVAVVARRPEPSNTPLVAALRELGVAADLLLPEEATRRLGGGDTAILRLDVLPTLDGIEPGLEHVPELERRGVRILNRPGSLIGAHDKLATASRLVAAGVPHPRTEHVPPEGGPVTLGPPVVVKPRFGSWGRDVVLCATQRELERRLAEMRQRPWFRLHGALVQELVPLRYYDLRLVVAGGRVVGACERVAAPGEWRTNVSLGGSRRRVVPSRAACELGISAAAAIGADLVGVDLLPTDGGDADYLVLELNGAVDFDAVYSIADREVYADLAAALGLVEATAPVEARA